jgi:hypothetical protein
MLKDFSGNANILEIPPVSIRTGPDDGDRGDLSNSGFLTTIYGFMAMVL